ncbi:hypothetical protein GGR51DRAFT_42401 [Nemania sp. FL0031]|nr:hypothetical protein GGR51DRAFT_42401 [Nemania sp. FL0031]
MEYRRSPSETSSIYSGGSVWSTSDSLCFVYTDDPNWAWYGYEGVRGAVTRKDDRRDSRRVRLAAHFLRGPFAGHKSKKHSSSRHHDSDARSDYSSSSAGSSSSRRRGGPSRAQMPMPMQMPMPPPQQQQQQFYPGSPQQYPQEPLPYDNFSPGPQMDMRPPPPPTMPGQTPQPGFEAGFIQLGGGGGGGGPPPNHDPVWGHEAQYGPGPEVY